MPVFDTGRFHVVAFYDENDPATKWLAKTAPIPSDRFLTASEDEKKKLSDDEKYKLLDMGPEGQWSSVEHYFQAMKHAPPAGTAPSAEEAAYIASIRAYGKKEGETPEKLAAFARRQQKKIFGNDKKALAHWRTNWDKDASETVMRRAIRAKLDQDKDARDRLLKLLPINTVIVSTLPNWSLSNPSRDKRWSDGSDGSGNNLLGRIYMEERLRLLAEKKEVDKGIEENVSETLADFRQHRNHRTIALPNASIATYRSYEEMMKAVADDKADVLETKIDFAKKAERPPATVHSSGGEEKTKSFLSGDTKQSARLYNIKRIHNLASKRQEIYDRLRRNSKGGGKEFENMQANRKTTVVRYDPNVFKNESKQFADVKEELTWSLRTRYEANRSDTNGHRPANTWRHNSKHRTVTSQVTCYANGYGEDLEKPIQLTITSCCAPNFMGSSPRDEREFTDGNGRLRNNGQPYQDFLKTLFKRVLSDQDKAKSQVVILPEIGGGIYLDQLSDEGKAEASRCYNQALREALNESKFEHIQEIVRPLPDTNGNDPNQRSLAFDRASHAFADFKGNPRVTIANTDALEAAIIAKESGREVGIINPGSDRTIGGAFEERGTGRNSHHTTLEEVLANVTDLAFVQASDYNPELGRVIEAYPPTIAATASHGKDDKHHEKKTGAGATTTILTKTAGAGTTTSTSKEVAPKTVTSALGAVPPKTEPSTKTVGSSMRDAKEKPINFREPENIRSIFKIFEEKGLAKKSSDEKAKSDTVFPGYWHLATPALDDKATAPVIFRKDRSEFAVHPSEIKTKNEDVDTFYAMLVAFHVTYQHEPDRLPQITSHPEPPETKAAWQAALKRASDNGMFRGKTDEIYRNCAWTNTQYKPDEAPRAAAASSAAASEVIPPKPGVK